MHDAVGQIQGGSGIQRYRSVGGVGERAHEHANGLPVPHRDRAVVGETSPGDVEVQPRGGEVDVTGVPDGDGGDAHPFRRVDDECAGVLEGGGADEPAAGGPLDLDRAIGSIDQGAGDVEIGGAARIGGRQ